MLPEPISGSDVSWFCFPMIADWAISGTKVVSHLQSRRMETRPILTCNIDDQPSYAASDFSGRSELPNTQRAAEDGISAGIHPSMGLEEIRHVSREPGAVLSGSSRTELRSENCCQKEEVEKQDECRREHRERNCNISVHKPPHVLPL